VRCAIASVAAIALLAATRAISEGGGTEVGWVWAAKPSMTSFTAAFLWAFVSRTIANDKGEVITKKLQSSRGEVVCCDHQEE
jgi:hypothetical protein